MTNSPNIIPPHIPQSLLETIVFNFFNSFNFFNFPKINPPKTTLPQKYFFN